MNKNTYEDKYAPRSKFESSSTSSSVETFHRPKNFENSPFSTPPTSWSEFDQFSVDLSGPSYGSGTNWDQQFILGNQSSQVFDGVSLASFINPESTPTPIESTTEPLSSDPSDMDISSNQNLHVEMVKFETEANCAVTSCIKVEETRFDPNLNFLRSPLVRSKSVQHHILPPPARPRSTSDPLPFSATELLGQIIEKNSHGGDEYMDIAPFVTYPQHEAAKKLNMPSSTLSKKWKDATVNRKWPYRILSKIDKEIATVMHNMQKNPNGALTREAEIHISELLHQRQQEMRPVIVRMT